ncbi:MAG: conjugal transfer protein TraS [Caldimonas sp.]
MLVQWGERLFYPGNRIVKSRTPRLGRFSSRADAIRSRIESTVRRAPQVMVKVTGGGRGMKAIAAHFRYISKNGRLQIEDDRGIVERGRDVLQDIERQWRYGGAYIDDVGDRREAFNVMLSMPKGTDPMILQKAAREFAKIEFSDHRYVMVLHIHQANPHVHLSVKAESKHGERLNPRKVDLHRWRETFAERLREWGIDAEATRQAVRGAVRNYPDLWRKKAAEEGRARAPRPERKVGDAALASRRSAGQAWATIAAALRASPDPKDRRLASDIEGFVNGRTLDRPAVKEQTRLSQEPQRDIGRSR